MCGLLHFNAYVATAVYPTELVPREARVRRSPGRCVSSPLPQGTLKSSLRVGMALTGRQASARPSLSPKHWIKNHLSLGRPKSLKLTPPENRMEPRPSASSASVLSRLSKAARNSLVQRHRYQKRQQTAAPGLCRAERPCRGGTRVTSACPLWRHEELSPLLHPVQDKASGCPTTTCCSGKEVADHLKCK